MTRLQQLTQKELGSMDLQKHKSLLLGKHLATSMRNHKVLPLQMQQESAPCSSAMRPREGKPPAPETHKGGT